MLFEVGLGCGAKGGGGQELYLWLKQRPGDWSRCLRFGVLVQAVETLKLHRAERWDEFYAHQHSLSRPSGQKKRMDSEIGRYITFYKP